MHQKIFEIAKKYSDKKNQASFMEWFLGDEVPTSENMLKYLFKKERDLSLENKRKIAKYSGWTFHSFLDKKKDEEKFEGELRKLYEDVFDKSEAELTINQILSHFLFQYLFGTIQPERDFREYEGNVCKNYVQMKEYLDFFDVGWSKSNIIVVYGKAGVGKSQLVKSYIQENIEQYKEISMLDECRSIQEGLLGIPFWIEKNKGVDSILDILKDKDATSLLVIDISILQDSDISFIKEYLLDLNIRIIITTYQKVPVKRIYQKQFDSLNDGTLRQIFDVNVGNKKYEISDEQFGKLLEIVDRNTLIIALLGKSIGREEIPVEELINEHEWIWSKTKVATVHAHEYGCKEGKSPLYHIGAILEKYGINREEYSELALWCKNNMSVDSLKTWSKYSNNMSSILSEAYRNGIIEYEDKNKKTIKMHSLIADAVWKFYPLKYKDYEKNIKIFQSNLAWGSERKIEYHMLYGAIYNLIQRFNFEIQKKKVERAVVDSYKSNLYYMIEFSIHSGNFYGAEKLIYFWDKFFGKDNEFKSNLWKFEVLWASENTEGIKSLKFKEYIFNQKEHLISRSLLRNKLSEARANTSQLVVRKFIMTDDPVGLLYNIDTMGELLRIVLDWYIRCIRVSITEREKKDFVLLVEKYIEYTNILKRIFNNEGDILSEVYKGYYVITLWCAFGKIKSELEESDVDEYINYLRKFDEFKELVMQVKLELLFWEMRFLITDCRDKEKVKLAEGEFEHLKEEYQDKLWPLHIDILFREVEILECILEQNKEILCDKIQDFSSIFKERVSTENEIREMQEIKKRIPDIIKSLEQFPL